MHFKDFVYQLYLSGIHGQFITSFSLHAARCSYTSCIWTFCGQRTLTSTSSKSCAAESDQEIKACKTSQHISCLKVATKWSLWDPWCLLPISWQVMILCVDRMLIGWKTTQSKSSVNHRGNECVKKKESAEKPWQTAVDVVLILSFIFVQLR